MRDAERRARWWRANRKAAPRLFEDELRAALELIRGEPDVGSVYRTRSGEEHRRVLLPRTRHHIYYRIVVPDLVWVVAIWNAVSARGPIL